MLSCFIDGLSSILMNSRMSAVFWFSLSSSGLIAWSSPICHSVLFFRKHIKIAEKRTVHSSNIYAFEMENFEACWDDSNWYFLVEHSFYILLPSILQKSQKKKKKVKRSKKQLSTFKFFSLINSTAIWDTQGELETDAGKNCKNCSRIKNIHCKESLICWIHTAERRD